MKHSTMGPAAWLGLIEKRKAHLQDGLKEAARRQLLGLVVVLLGVGVAPAFAQSSSVLQASSILAGGETRPASSALQPASAITIEAWVTSSTAVTNYPAFVSYGLDNASPYESYVLQAQSVDGVHPADFWFLTGSGTSHQVFGTTHLAAATQYFLTATYDGTSAKIYVNGTLEATQAVSGSLYYPGGTGLGLGRPYNRPANNFTGVERGVAIYSAALTATQIAAHYAAGPPTPVLSMSQVPSGGVTQAGSSPLQPSAAVTVATWINAPATLTNYPAFVSYGLDTTPYESYILQANGISGGYPAQFFFLTGSGTSHSLNGTTLLQTGTQYFLVASYDGATASLYLNGALQNTLSTTGTLYYPGGGLGLARKYADVTNNFTGTERGVAIYGTALPADRVLAQYQSGSPPTVPASFSATATSSTQVNLSWAASSDAVGISGYLVERCTGSSCTNFAQVGSTSAISYSDTGLTAATSYTYRVRAVNSGSNVSDYSSTANTTTSGGGGDTSPPTAPTSVGAVANSSSQITVTWTASTDNVGVTGYRVERCQGSGCSNFVQVGTPATSPYVDTGLSTATAYSYRVRATDAASNLGPYSSTASVTTNSSSGDTTPPSTPTGLSANAGVSVINLTWTASTDNIGVTGYLVERCQGAGCSAFTQVGTPSGQAYNDSGLAAMTSYTYRVRATDAAGNLSSYSATISAVTSNTLTTPSGLVIVASSSSEVDLAWSAAGGGSGTVSYLLERCTGVSCTVYGQIAAPSAAQYYDGSLTASTGYSYRVRATDGVGDFSAYSNIVSTATPASSPDCK